MVAVRSCLSLVVPLSVAVVTLAFTTNVAQPATAVDATGRWSSQPASPVSLPPRPDVFGDRPECAGTVAAMVGRAIPTTERPDIGAWYRLDPRLDADGTVVGSELTLGQERSRLMLTLDPESSASGPTGAAIVVVSDDGRRSSVVVVDAGLGCVSRIARSDAVVRRAVLEPGGGAILEHRVDRLTRSSLGIWRRPLAGGAETRVLAPIGGDARFGRTFTTELAWAADRRLVVQSCGETACRTRVVDLDRGRVASAIEDPEQGELIGLHGDELLTYSACAQLPCGIVATDLLAGRKRTIVAVAGFAALVAGDAGMTVVHEVGEPGSGSLRSTPLDGRPSETLALERGRMLAASPWRSRSAIAVPPGWLVISRDGRAGGAADPALIDPATGQVHDLDEVAR